MGWKEAPRLPLFPKAFDKQFPKEFSLLLPSFHYFLQILCIVIVANRYIMWRKLHLCRRKVERTVWNKATINLPTMSQVQTKYFDHTKKKRLHTEHLCSLNA